MTDFIMPNDRVWIQLRDGTQILCDTKTGEAFRRKYKASKLVGCEDVTDVVGSTYTIAMEEVSHIYNSNGESRERCALVNEEIERESRENRGQKPWESD